jgi:hypothetical protein
MTSFEPAHALIRFVTTLIERSLQEDESAPSGRTQSAVAPARVTKRTSTPRSERNTNPEE